MQDRQNTQRVGSRWGAFAVAAIAGTLTALNLASAGAAESDSDRLTQECIAAALEKPVIGKVGVRNAGRYGDGRTQFAYLDAQYGAMPDACHDDNIFREINDDIYRENQAKSQVLRNGKWRLINDWHSLYGGRWEGDPDPNSTWSNVNNQVAFKGRYISDPPLAHAPTRFDPCRVRILLKESAIRPWPFTYEGRKPAPVFATKIYKIEVPPGRISPRAGGACSLLAP